MNAIRRIPQPARVPIVAGAVVLLVAVLLPAAPTREVTVRVDLAAAAGSQIALYLNDFSDPPQIRALVPHVRTVYEFEGPAGDIERIRIDVHDATGSQVRYSGIQVHDEDGEVIADFPPSDLASWAGYSVAPQAIEPDAYAVIAAGPVAALDAFRRVTAPSVLPWPIEPMIRAVKEPERLLRLSFLALGLGAAVLGLRTPRGRRAVLVGALCAAVAVPVLDFVLSNPSGLSSAASAVGRATYYGLSLPTNIRAIEAMYVSTTLLALGGVVLWRWRNRATVSVLPPGSASEPPRISRSALLVAGVVGIAAVAELIPDLRLVVKEATEGQYPSGWDAENMIVWSEFAARGLVPMKDFWYPYGNFSLFDSGLVKGEIAYALYQLALFAVYWWIFWIAAERRLVASSFAALGLLAAEPIIGEFFRYGLALAVALAYTCIDPQGPPRLRIAARLIFGVLVTLSLFLDPILVGYAALGVAILLVVDVARARRLGIKWWTVRLGADFALPIVGLAGVSAVAVLRGQFDGLVELYLTLQETAAYSAVPTTLMTGVRSALDLSVFVVWIPPVLFGVGLFARLITPGGFLGHGLPSRLLVIGAVAAPLVLKHAVRITPTQLFLFPVIVVALVLLWASGRRTAWATTGILAGVATSVVLAYPGPERIWNDVKELPTTVAADVELLLLDRDELAEARSARFADERFASYPQELALAADLRNRRALRDDADLYVLGDAPVLYVLLRQRPPWQITAYNTSLIDDQQRVVDWLEEERPSVVVVDRLSADFDGIPHDVRVPLVFQHVISNYVFEHTTGSYDVLVRRRGEPIDVSYWERVTGGDSALGRVLDVSSYDDLESCSDHSECRPFLRLEAPSEEWAGPVNVPLRFGRRTVFVRFEAAGEKRVYTISLDRLWAWALSASPRIGRSIPSGWRARLVRAQQPQDVLY